MQAFTYPWAKGKRYYHFAHYLKKKYGTRIQKVTVDAGFTCPNRDGAVAKGGCVYCNNDSFNPSYNSSEKSIREQIDEGIEFLKRRYEQIDKFIVYFQPYSNTYAPLDKLKRLYEEALQHPEVIGLTIGTRPDCVDEAKIAYLQELAKDYDITIEYGLESFSDKTLVKINRGHHLQSYYDALELTQNRNIKICTHLIFDFPWETPESWIESAKKLSDSPLDFIKIHQLHVVKNTRLAKMYKDNPFDFHTPSEYINIIIQFLERLSPKIVVQRLFGEAPPETLIAPLWNLRNYELLKMLDDELEKQNSWQGKYFQ